MYSEGMKDIYPVIMEQLSTADIISLCQVSSKFKNICHSNKKSAFIMKLFAWLNDENSSLLSLIKTNVLGENWIKSQSKKIDSILSNFSRWKKYKYQDHINLYIEELLLPLHLPTSGDFLLEKQEKETRIQDLYEFYQEYLKI